MFFQKSKPYIADYFIIGIDFDGVLAQNYKAKIKYAKELFNLNLKLGQTKKEGFEKLISSLGKDLSYAEFTKAVVKRTLEYELPLNCKEVLFKLFKENFRFTVITSRTDEEYPYAEAFIKQNYGNLISNMHNVSFSDSKNKKKIGLREKFYFVKKLRPRIYIDDDLYKLKALENLPVELFYCRQPENLDKNLNIFDKRRINEFNDWVELYTKVIQIKRLHEAVCWKYKLKNTFSNLIEIFNQVHGLTNRQKENLLIDYDKVFSSYMSAA